VGRHSPDLLGRGRQPIGLRAQNSSPDHEIDPKVRGDAFTWQVTLEGRGGCLASIASFIIHCGKDMMTEDVTRRIMAPVESAVGMVAHLPYVLKVG
jgi:hypothetical protein